MQQVLNRQLSATAQNGAPWQSYGSGLRMLQSAGSSLSTLPSLIVEKSSQSLSPIYGHPSSPFAPALDLCQSGSDSPIRASQYPAGEGNPGSSGGSSGVGGNYIFGFVPTREEGVRDEVENSNRSLSLPAARTQGSQQTSMAFPEHACTVKPLERSATVNPALDGISGSLEPCQRLMSAMSQEVAVGTPVGLDEGGSPLGAPSTVDQDQLQTPLLTPEQQMQAMYMAAAMHSVYSPQAIAAGMQGAFVLPGYAGVVPFAGYPMNPFYPAAHTFDAFRGLGAPSMFPLAASPEAALYYQRALDLQASRAVAHAAQSDEPLRHKDASENTADGGGYGSGRAGDNTVAKRVAGGSRDGRRDGRKGRRDDRDKVSKGHLRLLEEMRGSKGSQLELKDLFGQLARLSQDQVGSRFIQHKLETTGPKDLESALEEILPRGISLMNDAFGNYVVQKFFDHCNDSQKKRLTDVMRGHIVALSLQMYGCRVVQKALEVLDKEVSRTLVSELDGHVMRCVHDQNGNHVIQKCIECLPSRTISYIVDCFLSQVQALAVHPYGCRVIQRILENCDEAEKKHVVAEEILSNAKKLSQDQYGNYVVQHIVQHSTDEDRERVVNQLAPCAVALSQHKFASNVMEKCLVHGNDAQRRLLIEKVVGEDAARSEDLMQMMRDQYGNYVVQRILEVCDKDRRELLLSCVRTNLETLKKYTYGKHIAARVEKLLSSRPRCGESEAE
eukprot:evm.model.scf_736EXC.5 EVM.evm.TU.scf_736EXC.5   scf_736EXC:32512-37009(-)